MRRIIAWLVANEELNFLLTNRLPRRLATRFVGWFSRLEQPLVARASIGLWRLFSDVDLSDADRQRWPSLHACFVRRLRPGARPFDANRQVLASPCDAIVGANGTIADDQLHQIKGMPYRLSDLLGSDEEAARLGGGSYVTLRLTAGMYHHFHAPADLTVEQVTYLSGDCWNVNPPALKRIERLFCRNERAALRCRLEDGASLTLVAVAAILVASIRLSFLDVPGLLRHGSSRRIAVNAGVKRGEAMGWFEHGSTILVLAPPGADLLVREGERTRAGQPLFRLAAGSVPTFGDEAGA